MRSLRFIQNIFVVWQHDILLLASMHLTCVHRPLGQQTLHLRFKNIS